MANSITEFEKREVLYTLEALVRDGHYMADLAGRFLDRLLKPLKLKKPISMPAEFLLELSAVIRIACWQRAEATKVLGDNFSAWQVLLDDLLRRLSEDPTSFCLDPKSCPSPLHRRVLWLWFENCSWAATKELGVDMVVQTGDQNVLLEALADLLWQNRHLAKQKETSHADTQQE